VGGAARLGGGGRGSRREATGVGSAGAPPLGGSRAADRGGDDRVPIPTGLTLVAIADTRRDGLDELLARAQTAVRSGATAVHLRLKGEDARTLLDATRSLVAALSVPVVVHDRADVAIAGGAAGVHLSSDEMPAAAVRAVVPPEMLVGASVGSGTDVELAAAADYVSVGPVFGAGGRSGESRALGVEELARLVRLVRVPVLAVGGIAPANVRSVLDAGAAGVAVIMGAFAELEAERAIRQLRLAIGT
jgi:thiamine-phosphate pyrophosphorylase